MGSLKLKTLFAARTISMRYFVLLIALLIGTIKSSNSATEVQNNANNLNSALYGYNPLYGNLLKAGSADPGTRSKIFEAFDSEMNVMNFIDINFDKNCAADNHESIYQTMHEYNLKKIGSYANLPQVSESFSTSDPRILIEELKINVQAASEGHESSFEKESLIFRNNAGEIYLNELRCQVYTVSINDFVEPQFTTNFENGIKMLYEAYQGKDSDTAESNEKVTRFLQEFGTHYMQTTFLGASLSIESRWSSKAKKSSERQARQHCLSAAFSESVSTNISILGIFDGSSALTFKNRSKACKSNTFDAGYFSSNDMRETNIVSRGASFNCDPMEWSKTAKIDPVPIDFKLRSISYLLKRGRVDYLLDQNQNMGVKLGEYLQSATSEYCKTVLGRECPPIEGCGVNFVCESDPGKGFTFFVEDQADGEYSIKGNDNVTISGQIQLKSGNYTLIGRTIKAKLKIGGSLCQFQIDTQGAYNIGVEEESKNCVIKRETTNENYSGFIIENFEEKEAKCQYQHTSTNVSVQGKFNLPPGQEYAVISQEDDTTKIQCSFPGVSSSCDLLSANPGTYRLVLDENKCDLYMLVQ